MPSVTDTTVPWLRMSAETARPSMRLLISSEISAGLSCMLRVSVCRCGSVEKDRVGRPGSGAERGPHLLEPRPDRGVEHLVADDDADAADQLGLDHHARVELAAEALLQRRDDV